jgi:hypothetical protein
MSDLHNLFAVLARTFFAEHPGIGHEWRHTKSLAGPRVDLIVSPNKEDEVLRR